MPFRAWSHWQAEVIRASVRSAPAASACGGTTACARLQGRRIQVAVHRIGTGALAYEVAELGAAQVVLDLRVVDVFRHVGPACVFGVVVVGQRRNREQRGKGTENQGVCDLLHESLLLRLKCPACGERMRYVHGRERVWLVCVTAVPECGSVWQ